MGSEIKISIGVILGSLVLIAAIVAFAGALDTPDSIEMADAIGEATHAKGNPDASIQIVEFSDFQCPSCQSAYPIVEKFMSDYADQVYFVYRHFPLPSHQNARQASYAAEAAGAQGKFWEAHDWLFKNQNTWSGITVDGEYFFTAFGESLMLDKDKFLADYTDGVLRERVSNDLADGRTFGVAATPTFYINGQKEAGVLTYEDLVALTGVQTASPAPTTDVSPTEIPSPTPQ